MKKQPQLEVKFVPHRGEIGCGSAVEAYDNVLPFLAKSELFPVAVPVGIPASDVWLMTVRGPSLNDFLIFDGDHLVITKVFSLRDVDDDTIFAVYIHATGELVAKRITKGANTVTLRASGGSIKDLEYAIDEIELRGIVIDVQIPIRTQIARAREAKGRLNGNGGRPKRPGKQNLRHFNRLSDEDIPY
jgi:SOS-response transcriptional repressor LexA